MLVLVEEQKDDVVGAPLLEGLGLTRRQAEVLRWVTEGKTNPEIGVILGLSSATVHHHLERVYQKLGVETRTGAVAAALDFIRSS